MESCLKLIAKRLKLTLKIYGERWLHATGRRGKTSSNNRNSHSLSIPHLSTTFEKTFSSTFEKTLHTHMNELENRLNSRLLGSASTSYNSERLHDVPSSYNLPSVPIQQDWLMRSTYSSLNMVDPKLIPLAQYACQTATASPVSPVVTAGQTVATSPVKPDVVAGPIDGAMQVRPQLASLLGSAPTSAVPSNPMTTTRLKTKS
uniref:Uncharacterized protein n=1 Tax=Oryza punctata TaxID=4537 RepID=A0A0E0JJA8_ORYPU